MQMVATYYTGKDETEAFGKIEVEAETYEDAQELVLEKLPEGAKISSYRIPDRPLTRRFS